MKQQIKRYAVMVMVLIVFQCMLPHDGFWSVAASSQVSVNINIGAPPPVVVRTRPTMIFLPEPAAYVAVGIPYDIYFVSGHYYYLHGNDWFLAQGYNGPWVYVSYNTLPPGLRKYRVERLHEFREREYKVYSTKGPEFKGKHFEAEEHKSSSKEQGNAFGQGNGNSGRGNSKKN